MATTKLQTRILNKISTWTEWESVKSTFKPLRGEICIVEIPSGTSSTGLTPPAVGIKVGNGTDFFGDLPWIQAVAGDVTAWCKTNMADYNSFKTQVDKAVADANGGFQDALDALAERVTSLENIVKTGDNSNENLRAAITSTNEVVSSHTTQLGTLSTDKADKTQVATDIKTAKDNILGEDSASSDKTVAGAYKAAADAQDSADAAAEAAGQALTDANDYTDQEVGKVLGKEGDAATAKTVYGAHAAAAAAQSKADTNAGDIVDIKQDIIDINNALGGSDGNSVNKRLTDLETNDGVQDGKIQDNTDAINAEKERAEGVEAGLRTDVNKALAFLNDATIDPENTKLVDTLKEIQEYITSDETGASEMLASIQANTEAIGAEKTRAEKAEADLQDAIDGLRGNALKTDTLGTVKKLAEDAGKAASDNLDTAKDYAEEQAAAVLGKDGDAATVKTVYGAHAAAAAAASAAGVADDKAVAAQTAADAAQNDADAANTAIGKLLGSSVAEANGKISTISFADGKISATRKDIVMADMSATEVFIFDCGSATVNAANLTI